MEEKREHAVKRAPGKKIVISLFVITIALVSIASFSVYNYFLGLGGCGGCMTPVIAMIKGETDNNWTFTVTSISGGAAVPLSDIYIIAQAADGSVLLPARSLSEMNGTGIIYDHGVGFHDITYPHVFIAVGDEITLDKAIYSSGSGFGLFDPEGVMYNMYSVDSLAHPIVWVPPTKIDWTAIFSIAVVILTFSIIAIILLFRKRKAAE